MTTASRTWRVPTLPLRDWTFITLIGWAGLLLISAAISIGIDRFNEVMAFFGRETSPVQVTESVWVVMSGIVPWYIGIVCGYYVHEYLPAFVANGRTRRDSSIEAGLFALMLAGLIALLITLGFVVERGLYALMGWSRGTPDDQLFTSYHHLPAIAGATLLTALVWAAAGMAIGAAYYRGNVQGMAMALVAVFLLVASGITGGTISPFTGVSERIAITSEAGLITLLGVVAAGIMLVLGWTVVRDTPVRNT